MSDDTKEPRSSEALPDFGPCLRCDLPSVQEEPRRCALHLERRGKCPPNAQCLACDRLGYHIEPRPRAASDDPTEHYCAACKDTGCSECADRRTMETPQGECWICGRTVSNATGVKLTPSGKLECNDAQTGSCPRSETARDLRPPVEAPPALRDWGGDVAEQLANYPAEIVRVVYSGPACPTCGTDNPPLPGADRLVPEVRKLRAALDACLLAVITAEDIELLHKEIARIVHGVGEDRGRPTATPVCTCTVGGIDWERNPECPKHGDPRGEAYGMAWFCRSCNDVNHSEREWCRFCSKRRSPNDITLVPRGERATHWPTTDEGATHTRLTRIVDENLGYRPTAPIETLLSDLERYVPKAMAIVEAAIGWCDDHDGEDCHFCKPGINEKGDYVHDEGCPVGAYVLVRATKEGT